jgi:hypothetical protein
VYSKHIREERDGLLQPLTNCGAYTIAHLRLNRETLRRCRQRKRAMLQQLVVTYRLIRKLRLGATILDPSILDQLENYVDTLRTEFFRPPIPIG